MGIFEDRDKIWVKDDATGVGKRIISPIPKLANMLLEREPMLVPKETYEWGVKWISDIGLIMRSRSFLAYNAASMISGPIMALFPKLLFQKSSSRK